MATYNVCPLLCENCFVARRDGRHYTRVVLTSFSHMARAWPATYRLTRFETTIFANHPQTDASTCTTAAIASLILCFLEPRLATATHASARKRYDALDPVASLLWTLDRQSSRPATSSKDPLQDYCTTCIHHPAFPTLPFAGSRQTFQADSRLQPMVESSRQTP